MNVIETLKARLQNGNKAEAALVYDQDSDATNPREGDNLGAILIAPSKAHWVAGRDHAVDTSIPFGNNPYEHWENIRKEQLKIKKADIAISYPITKYEHGEIFLQLGHKSGWDYCALGFVYITKAQLREWYGTKRITPKIIERANARLQAELDMLTAWLNGECYGWCVKEYALSHDGLGWEEIDILDSCYGYFDQEQAAADMLNQLNQLTKTL